jgi:UDP-N-acetylglucosamine acyltransferase
MIHPTAIIDDNVVMGDGVTVGAYTVINGPCAIGNHVTIDSHCRIGGAPQITPDHPAVASRERLDYGVAGSIIIGDNTIIREHVVIHHGVYLPTVIGDDCYIMCAAHIGHDTTIGSRTTVGSHTAFGGFNTVFIGSTFGQGVITHPWTIIGHGAMVGMNTTVLHHVFPYQKVAGAPAKMLGKNRTAPWCGDDWDADLVPESDVVEFMGMMSLHAKMKHRWRNESLS